MLETSANDTKDIPVNYFGALDIGSNSFHFIFARVIEDTTQILHSEKYRVRLAQGLDNNNQLNQGAITRGINALKDIAKLTEKLSADNFRIVATYTLRQAKNAKQFLDAAHDVLPFDIEVISGHEEARIIYQGVTQHSPPNIKRLVIDIGGGSTECIVGKNQHIKHLTSLNIGCVNLANRYFSSGKLSKQAFDKAIIHAQQEIESHVKRFKLADWQQVLGTSGTIKSIYHIINDKRESPSAITRKELNALKQQLIQFKHTDNITLAGLKESRRHIVAPGLAVLIGIVEMLDIDAIDYCPYALREGVLSEQLAKVHTKDVRDRTIGSLVTRFNVDIQQVENIKAIADKLFNDAQSGWTLIETPYKKLLHWAIQVHEIGFDINPSAYHKHGRYIILNADMPGFNMEQQQAIAWLVGGQRKKLLIDDIHQWYLLELDTIFKLTAILRLAILLGQQRQLIDQIPISLTVKKKSIELIFANNWLKDRTLIKADLLQEQKNLKAIGIKLTF